MSIDDRHRDKNGEISRKHGIKQRWTDGCCLLSPDPKETYCCTNRLTFFLEDCEALRGPSSRLSIQVLPPAHKHRRQARRVDRLSAAFPLHPKPSLPRPRRALGRRTWRCARYRDHRVPVRNCYTGRSLRRRAPRALHSDWRRFPLNCLCRRSSCCGRSPTSRRARARTCPIRRPLFRAWRSLRWALGIGRRIGERILRRPRNARQDCYGSRTFRRRARRHQGGRAHPVEIRHLGRCALRTRGQQTVAAQALPVVGAVGDAAANYAFIEHFQVVARGHVTVRRLERLYGKEKIRSEYDLIASGL